MGVGLNTVAVAAVATNAVIASITTTDNFEFIPEEPQIIIILARFSRCFHIYLDLFLDLVIYRNFVSIFMKEGNILTRFSIMAQSAFLSDVGLIRYRYYFL
jgi:hypothetical protein